MPRLITVVGNSGVGKTTLTRIIKEELRLVAGLEEHGERPFQAAFKQDQRFGLANQVDYFLLRAEQEMLIRQDDQDGILDGGLEMDLHVFSRLFLDKGWLTDKEFSLLERLYIDLRRLLPPPEIIIYMEADIRAVTQRFQTRGRPLEIATIADLRKTEGFLQTWIHSVDPDRLIRIDASADDPLYRGLLPTIIRDIQGKFSK